MLTNEQIEAKALKTYSLNAYKNYARAYALGATWATEQCVARILEMEIAKNKVYERKAARIAELDGILKYANEQIQKERNKVAELEADNADCSERLSRQDKIWCIQHEKEGQLRSRIIELERENSICNSRIQKQDVIIAELEAEIDRLNKK